MVKKLKFLCSLMSMLVVSAVACFAFDIQVKNRNGKVITVRYEPGDRRLNYDGDIIKIVLQQQEIPGGGRRYVVNMGCARLANLEFKSLETVRGGFCCLAPSVDDETTLEFSPRGLSQDKYPSSIAGMRGAVVTIPAHALAKIYYHKFGMPRGVFGASVDGRISDVATIRIDRASGEVVVVPCQERAIWGHAPCTGKSVWDLPEGYSDRIVVVRFLPENADAIPPYVLVYLAWVGSGEQESLDMINNVCHARTQLLQEFSQETDVGRSIDADRRALERLQQLRLPPGNYKRRIVEMAREEAEQLGFVYVPEEERGTAMEDFVREREPGRLQQLQQGDGPQT
jgi:hypothetical protein